MKKRYYWMLIDTGELMTRQERDEYLINECDFDDWTNALEVYEYFEKTDIEY